MTLDRTDQEYYDDANYYAGVSSYQDRAIDYIDSTPTSFELQIPLVEYFERIKRLKADKWQIHFCEYLQNAVINRHIKPTFAEFHAQAQLGKTVILSQIFPAWCFGHDPLFRYVLAMYNVSRSESHSDVIVQIMRSELHREIFPNVDGHLPKFAARSGWMTNARRDVAKGHMDAQKSLNPVGLESGMTGSGFDWLTIDDPYKEPRDAWSETMYQNLARFWEYGVIPRLASHACVAAMFHRYAYDDFGGYLLNTGTFDYVRYAAEADGDYVHDETGQRFADPLGRAPGELICPERFGLNYYESKRSDTKMWLSMFQGRPGKQEGDFFQVDKIEVIGDDIRASAEWAACQLRGRGWDHAVTQGSGDQSAGALMGVQPSGFAVVKDVFSDQLDSGARVAKQKELAEEDGHDTTVVVPQGLAADGTDVVFFMQQHLKEFNVVGRKVTNAAPGSDAKKRRAYPLSVACNSGKLKFLAGPWVDRVKRLMRRFGNAITGDDEIDALADVYNFLYEELHKGLVVPAFSEKNLESWDVFTEQFGPKIPAHWTLYAALKVAPDASRANSGVIVARAADNSGLKDTLFIVDEYKQYGTPYENLFTWMDASLKANCESPKTAVIWLHPDSEAFAPAIRQKLQYAVRLFAHDDVAGITEANWYTQAHGDVTRMYGLMRNAESLPALRQEPTVWGFDAKGEPTKVAQVWDCLRMIAHCFKTAATPLTMMEEYQKLIPQSSVIPWEAVKAENRPPTLEEQTRQDFAVYQAQQKIIERYGLVEQD